MIKINIAEPEAFYPMHPCTLPTTQLRLVRVQSETLVCYHQQQQQHLETRAEMRSGLKEVR